jgi:hypothetical protein
VPAENRVGGDHRRNLRQTPTTERRSEGRQAPLFVVGEPHALVVQVRLQNPVLFAQVLDDLVLLVLEPADKKRDEQVQRNHASSLRQLPRDVFGHYGLGGLFSEKHRGVTRDVSALPIGCPACLSRRGLPDLVDHRGRAH